MSKFLIQLVLFASLVAGGYVFIRENTPVSKDAYTGFSYYYMMGLRLKHERAKCITTPKIMFVGGSSYAYGIDSEFMENNTSVPVVNLGLHGGFGVPYILEEAKSLMRKGDVIFLCIEYFMGDGDYRLLQETFKYFPEVADFQQFPLKRDVISHINETRKGLHNWANNREKDKYSDDDISIAKAASHGQKVEGVHFNKYGDINFNYKESEYSMSPEQTKYSFRYWGVEIELMNEFMAEAKAKGVDVYFSYPPHAKSSFDKNVENFAETDKEIRRDLKIEILNTPEQLAFEDSFFYDTEYHLTAKGRDLRSKIMLETIANNKNARASVIRAGKAQVK
jgi:hypothetical protein